MRKNSYIPIYEAQKGQNLLYFAISGSTFFKKFIKGGAKNRIHLKFAFNSTAHSKYYSDVTQYNRLAAKVAHFTVFLMFKDIDVKKVFLKDQKKIKTPILYFT